MCAGAEHQPGRGWEARPGFSCRSSPFALTGVSSLSRAAGISRGRGLGTHLAPTPPRSLASPMGIPTHHPRVYSIHSRTVTRYPANSIVVVGGCPVCRVGVLEDCFTFLGIFLAIILFPFGFICCFALRKRRCPNCGATFT
ncbi:membrane protein BRI3 isoform X1 [Cynocephalus volans]|uniref:membrane protein BRI3 isoform X1 n=1 Tax=Cynocephalus volans TaxID=110931 RepID=UPI002FC70477